MHLSSLPHGTTDYRCENRKSYYEIRSDIGAIIFELDLVKITVQSGDAFEDIAFKPGFDILSNSKPGCRVSVLHFFVEVNSTNGFLKASSFDK